MLRALVIAASLAFAPAAFAQGAGDLSGVWQGVYWGAATQATTFQATLDDKPGPAFSGSIVEPNTFGNTESPFLLATVDGAVRAGRVTFLKTYDGTAGASHTVNYDGRIISDRRIVGTWQIDGTSGQFELAR